MKEKIPLQLPRDFLHFKICFLLMISILSLDNSSLLAQNLFSIELTNKSTKSAIKTDSIIKLSYPTYHKNGIAQFVTSNELMPNMKFGFSIRSDKGYKVTVINIDTKNNIALLDSFNLINTNIFSYPSNLRKTNFVLDSTGNENFLFLVSNDRFFDSIFINNLKKTLIQQSISDFPLNTFLFAKVLDTSNYNISATNGKGIISLRNDLDSVNNFVLPILITIPVVDTNTKTTHSFGWDHDLEKVLQYFWAADFSKAKEYIISKIDSNKRSNSIEFYLAEQYRLLGCLDSAEVFYEKSLKRGLSGNDNNRVLFAKLMLSLDRFYGLDPSIFPKFGDADNKIISEIPGSAGYNDFTKFELLRTIIFTDSLYTAKQLLENADSLLAIADPLKLPLLKEAALDALMSWWFINYKKVNSISSLKKNNTLSWYKKMNANNSWLTHRKGIKGFLTNVYAMLFYLEADYKTQMDVLKLLVDSEESKSRPINLPPVKHFKSKTN